jgi:DNA-binding XRE family transcriptional regulator
MISKRPPKRTKRSIADRNRLRQLRDRFQRDRPSLESLVASGEYTGPIPQSDFLMMLQLAAELKKTRKGKRLSLADVARKSGIDKAAISRIENGQNVNPTIGTLETIARSLGAQLQFRLAVGTR